MGATGWNSVIPASPPHGPAALRAWRMRRDTQVSPRGEGKRISLEAERGKGSSLGGDKGQGQEGAGAVG